MNNKLLKGTLAGVAVVALAAGGGTFASWSDYDTVEDNTVGADLLKIDLSTQNKASFDRVHLAPGVSQDTLIVVANTTGNTIPAADLSVTLTNLVGEEDGCTSTNSEQDVDSDCAGNNEGEFASEAIYVVNAAAPSADGTCSPRGARLGTTVLAAAEDLKVDLLPAGVDLEPGQKVCVAMGIALPANASNASQGDRASFDLRFDLEQVL